MGVVAPLILKGLLLGWSVAWPPGPINSEMIRRGLSRGFWPAFSLSLGACAGDFLWALGVTLGAGALADIRGVQIALAAISFILLLVLAATFFKHALHGWRVHRGVAAPRAPSKLDTSRGGLILGFGMALSSPWNIAFWLAVVGTQARTTLTITSSLILAASVVIGATTWGLVLCTATRLGARFASPMWEVVTNAATALLMLFFAVQLALRML
jgi:threonine/homoserine/homoserine lactone efflux protein